MLEMWQALATGLGTNMSSHSEQGKAIAADKVMDMPVMGIWFNDSPNAKQYCTLGGEDFVLVLLCYKIDTSIPKPRARDERMC